MAQRSPTPRQLLGLAVTLAAVAVFSGYALWQIAGLRRLQSEILDRNRRDTLQLIRIQNDLNQLALTVRDMAEGADPYPITAYRQQMERIRGDLDDAFEKELALAQASRRPEQLQLLRGSSDRFWQAMNEVWNLAGSGQENQARTLIRTRIEAERNSMGNSISRLLVLNNEAEGETAEEIQLIYGRVERNVYLLLAAVVAAISATSFFVIRHNRQVFERLARVSQQRKELAGQIISVQEDIFRTLARELHDEFGQVLTAVGVMLARAERRVPAEIPALKGDIHEVREIAQQTLERARTMSQMLHPPVLDDYGLEKSIEWYLSQFEKQTQFTVHYAKQGTSPWLGDQIAIHGYRILQEALTNVVKHARTQEVWVRATYSPETLMLEIEDHGVGIGAEARRGIGLIAMRERAELLHGSLELVAPESGGTRVVLNVPLQPGVENETAHPSVTGGRS